MTRKHAIAIAKAIRDSAHFEGTDDRYGFAVEMAALLGQPGMAKNFDRDLFLAYATSVSEE